MKEKLKSYVGKITSSSKSIHITVRSLSLNKLLMLVILTLSIPFSVSLVNRIVKYFAGAEVSTANVIFQNSQDNILTPSSSRTLRLTLQANTNKVSFIHFQITFDPSKIRLSGEVTPVGPLKREILRSTYAEANSTGKVTLVYGLEPADRTSPATGTFTLASLPFTAVTGTPNESTVVTVDTTVGQVVDISSIKIPFTVDTYTFILNPVAATATPTPPVVTATPTPISTITPPPINGLVFTTVDDTHVKSAYPTSSYASSTTLETSNYTSSNTLISYLKFDLTSLAGKTVTGAVLKLQVALNRTVDKNIKLVPSSSWTGTNVNWNNKPALGDIIGQLPTQAVQVGEYISIPLNAAVINQYTGTLMAVAIDNTSSGQNTLEVYSRDSVLAGSRPVLEITLAQGSSLTSTEDTMVKSNYPSSNYASSTFLQASNYTSTSTIQSYLKFDLSSLVGHTITGANLKLKVYSSRTIEKDIKLVIPSSWSESGLTWNNRPPMGETIGHIPNQAVVAGTSVTIPLDVSLISQYAGQILSLGIDNTSVNQSTFAFYSRESTLAESQPSLEISVSP